MRCSRATPLSAPVIAATRLRKGSTNSARGAGRFLTDAWPLPGASGSSTDMVWMGAADSAYYGYGLDPGSGLHGRPVEITCALCPHLLVRSQLPGRVAVVLDIGFDSDHVDLVIAARYDRRPVRVA